MLQYRNTFGCSSFSINILFEIHGCWYLKEFYLYANVMDAPSLVLFQESSDRTLLAKWVKELELGVVEVDKHSGHAVLGQGLRQEGVSHMRHEVHRISQTRRRYFQSI